MEDNVNIKIDEETIMRLKALQFDRPPGTITCIYGPSGSGKSYLAHKLREGNTIILDGDAVRAYINNDLGFSDEDREENNNRIAKIAYLLGNQGFDVVISTVRADIAYEKLKEKNYPNIRKIQCFIS